jgi:hypothetical protein
MKKAPHIIHIAYTPETASGMVCAYSDDLRGFRVYGKSDEELQREVPIVASAMVREIFGVDCDYHWSEVDQGVLGLARQLVPAHASCQ